MGVKTAPLPANAVADKPVLAIGDKDKKMLPSTDKNAAPPPPPEVPDALAEGMTSMKRHSIMQMEEEKKMASIWARIAYNSNFESLTMFFIVTNALWIGIDTEWNHESLRQDGKLPLEPTSIFVENIYCVYFTFELIVRFLAFSPKSECAKDSWFVFDSVLVACMIFETWLMVIIGEIMKSASDGEQEAEAGGTGALSSLRLLRLLRLARMGRLMRFVPELGKLVKGMIKAARSVVFILIFLVLVMYVFAIIFTGTFADRTKYPLTPYCHHEEARGDNLSDDCVDDPAGFGELGQDLFASMGDSVMTLFTRGVLGDNLDETVQAILDQSLVLMWLFFIFFAITFATLLNMLIGVICEVISDSAAEEEEENSRHMIEDTIVNAFHDIDQNSDGTVCVDEWNQMCDNPDLRLTMTKIGIEEEMMEERLQQMSAMLFVDQEVDEETGERAGLTLDQLVQRVVDIRPDQDASALDLELLKAQTSKDHMIMKNRLRKIKWCLRKHVNTEFHGENKPGSPNNKDRGSRKSK